MEPLIISPQQTLVQRLEADLLAVNRIAARRLFQESGLCAVDFAEEVVVPALERVGEAWEKGEVALAQVYMSGRICEELMGSCFTIGDAAPFDSPRLALAVLNDSHLLGKRLVHAVLRAGGFAPLDYGQISLEDLAARLQRDAIEIVLVSTLMLPSALQVKQLRERLDALGTGIKLVVGGAPFRLDRNLWREVGAHATSPTASGVVAVVKDLAAAKGYRG